MASDKKMLTEAAQLAVKSSGSKLDKRTFFLGSIGLRNDGVFVSAKNISAQNVNPSVHAEARLVRKMTPDSTVWVARVARRDGAWALAKPCHSCQVKLRAAGVARVVYTIGPDEWGVMDLKGSNRQ
jgi:cytidine deaminase